MLFLLKETYTELKKEALLGKKTFKSSIEARKYITAGIIAGFVAILFFFCGAGCLFHIELLFPKLFFGLCFMLLFLFVGVSSFGLLVNGIDYCFSGGKGYNLDCCDLNCFAIWLSTIRVMFSS